MKRVLLSIVFMLCSGIAFAADKAPPPTATLSGKVLEVKDVETYTYLRLKTKDGETWAAVGKAPVKVGAEVTIENAMVMSNFESRTLKKTFDKIVFGSLAVPGATAAAAPKGGDMAAIHAGVSKPVEVADVKVAKATGPDARTVAEVATSKAALKDKPVVVRGKVVKFNPGILGKNWVHLRDGTGSAADGSNDILVTTKDETKVGDVVLAKGTVRTDRDFGSGYSYKLLVEDATLQK